MSPLLAGFTWLLVFQCLGEALVRLAGLPIPGPVAGLALLWGLAAAAVLGPLLTTSDERRALLQRLARPLAWRRA